MSQSVTNLRIRYLDAIKKVCERNITGLAEPREVAAELGEQGGVNSLTKVRTMMYRLKDLSWVVSPKNRLFRLTAEGERVLSNNTAK